MPWITDYNDSIDITGEQAEELNRLAGRNYIIPMGWDKYMEEQLKIVPESNGYQYCIPRHGNKMYKRVELESPPKEKPIKGSIGYLIRFNEVDEDGNMFLPDSVHLSLLKIIKSQGMIQDFEVDETGVKVTY